MGVRTKGKTNNGSGLAVASKGTLVEGARRRPRSPELGDRIGNTRDLAAFMGALVGDIVSGRIDPMTANAACRASGTLLRIVELEHKYGRKPGAAPASATEKNGLVLAS